MAKQGSLSEAMADLKEQDVKKLVKQQIKERVAAADILAECQAGLAQVGKRFEKGEYFISELMYAGEVMKEIMAQLEPMLGKQRGARGGAGVVVLGTVKGDIHDIGKDVVALMLRGSGFKVVDLGVDVPADKFVKAVKDSKPIVVGMSVFLTTCFKAIGDTVEALKKAGLREKVSIMIGGAAASQLVAERTGCDFYGATAVDAVKHATGVVAH